MAEKIKDVETECHLCHKPMYIPDKTMWVYRRKTMVDNTLTHKYFCSYSCMCKYDRMPPSNKKLYTIVDSDVHDWLVGYTARMGMSTSKWMNTLLREIMEDDMRSAE